MRINFSVIPFRSNYQASSSKRNQKQPILNGLRKNVSAKSDDMEFVNKIDINAQFDAFEARLKAQKPKPEIIIDPELDIKEIVSNPDGDLSVDKLVTVAHILRKVEQMLNEEISHSTLDEEFETISKIKYSIIKSVMNNSYVNGEFSQAKAMEIFDISYNFIQNSDEIALPSVEIPNDFLSCAKYSSKKRENKALDEISNSVPYKMYSLMNSNLYKDIFANHFFD